MWDADKMELGVLGVLQGSIRESDNAPRQRSPWPGATELVAGGPGLRCGVAPASPLLVAADWCLQSTKSGGIIDSSVLASEEDLQLSIAM